jgi:hypothetical protein
MFAGKVWTQATQATQATQVTQATQATQVTNTLTTVLFTPVAFLVTDNLTGEVYFTELRSVKANGREPGTVFTTLHFHCKL